ncbi:MAG: methyltransferase domain-containing protein, partial [Rhodoferax sp.]|nr:methyltransferase domain-containing protein [Actinomycetota bacterium]
MAHVTDTRVFDEHAAAWRAWQRTPWGRLRYRLVAQLLDRHVAALPAGTVVLDVGGADGADSRRFAERGLAVTVVDPSAVMLDTASQQDGVRTAVLTLA